MIALELPYPPSGNMYYRHVGPRVLISGPGRQYRQTIILLLMCARVKKLLGRLEVEIHVHPPDKRRRDLDNIQKCLLDSLCHGGAYADDSQIDDLVTRRKGVVKGGKVLVWIKEKP